LRIVLPAIKQELTAIERSHERIGHAEFESARFDFYGAVGGTKIWGEIWDVAISKSVIIEVVPVAIAGEGGKTPSPPRKRGHIQKSFIFSG
jgi:hypothetical protein